MPTVKAYRKKDGTLVRAHSRGNISIGSFRGRVSGGSLSHLRHVGSNRTPGVLRAALSDWSASKTYMDGRGNLRYKKSQGGGVTPYNRKVKGMYKLGTRGTRSFEFSNRAQRDLLRGTPGFPAELQSQRKFWSQMGRRN